MRIPSKAGGTVLVSSQNLETSMPQRAPDAIGVSIAMRRKIASLTQRELAEAAHIGVGSLRKIEQGERLPTKAVIASIAAALRITVEEINGQPYRGHHPSQERVHAPIEGIREAVSRWNLGPGWYTQPRPLPALAREIQFATRLREAARYTRLGEMLPQLIEELTAAYHLRAGREQTRAATLLAHAYYMAHFIAYRLGYPDLDAQLQDRLMWAAGQTGDPLLVSLGEWTRASAVGYRRCRHGEAIRLLDGAAERLAAGGVDDRDPRQVTVAGSLVLQQANFAAMAGDADGAAHYLGEARRLAGALSADRVHYHLTFGPAQVAIHEVSIELELRRPGSAASLARQVRLPASLPRTRTGSHHVHAARAFADVGDRNGALVALLEARRVAPQQTRFQPQARDTAVALAGRYRVVPRELRALLNWLGVQETS